MTDKERDDYPNLLLLCPNHSTQVDDLEPSRFPAEVLQAMKARAEAHAEPPEKWTTEGMLDDAVRQLVNVTARLQSLGPLVRIPGPAVSATLRVDPGRPPPPSTIDRYEAADSALLHPKAPQEESPPPPGRRRAGRRQGP